MPFYASAIFSTGTFITQLAVGTDLRRSFILIVVALFVIVPFSQDMPGRTGKGVIVRVIDKGFLWKDVLLTTRSPLCLFQGIKMSLYSEIMAGKIIFSGPVFAVCHNDFSFSASIIIIMGDAGSFVSLLNR